MQFCPRCGSQNQDDRAACWKCFGRLQKADSKKAQRIVLKDTAVPLAGAPIGVKHAEEVVTPIAPIPELAEPEPAVRTPDLTFDLPAPEPEVAEPDVAEPAVDEKPDYPVAALGDIMMPSPSFGAADETEETPTEAVPILGLVNLSEDEQEEPVGLDLDEPDNAPVIGARSPSDEPLVVEPADDAQNLEGTGEEPLPWWMTQDETEEASTAEKDKPVLDLDDGGLEIIPLDDAREVVSFEEEEEEDPDSKKSPPDA